MPNKDLEREIERVEKIEEFRKKQANIREWLATALATITLVLSIIVAITAKNAVLEIEVDYENQLLVYNEEILNSQEQSQILQNELVNIQEQYVVIQNELVNVQEQYVSIQNIVSNQQSVDVIEARDNDVLIMTPDGKWLVVPMIEKDDINFSTEIIEIQYNAGENTLDRIDLFNNNDEDWTSRDSFTYTIGFLSINQNKMVSLYQFIKSIDIEMKLYNNDQSAYESAVFNVYSSEDESTYLNLFENLSPENQFVTKELNDGIEDIKITVLIEFEIGGNTFVIKYNFDEYVTVNPDL